MLAERPIYTLIVVLARLLLSGSLAITAEKFCDTLLLLDRARHEFRSLMRKFCCKQRERPRPTATNLATAGCVLSCTSRCHGTIIAAWPWNSRNLRCVHHIWTIASFASYFGRLLRQLPPMRHRCA